MGLLHDVIGMATGPIGAEMMKEHDARKKKRAEEQKSSTDNPGSDDEPNLTGRAGKRTNGKGDNR